jgi:tetratricopeptide (TPR) repeat protein
MRQALQVVVILLVSALVSPVAAQTRAPGAAPSMEASRRASALYDRGVAAFQKGHAAEAETLFRQAVAANPRNLDYHVALAEALVAQKRLSEAERVLLAVRPPGRGSRRLELLLAQIRLWQGQLHEAAVDFRALVTAAPADAEAREGLANALYWSGDWPAAAREYRELLRLRPNHAAARAALAEIERNAAAIAEVRLSMARDDQPYHRARGQVSFTPAAESLTRWRVDAGSYFLDATDQGVSATAPFAALHVARSFPRARLSAEVWARGVKFPDGETKLLGGGAIRRPLSPHSRLSLTVDQQELLYTTTSLLTHPYVTTATLRWDLEQPSGWYAAAYGEARRYFDDNSGVAVGAFAAAPVMRTPSLTLWVGGGASYRDTSETRFRLERMSSRPRPGGGFTYQYEGIYDPYWTPIETAEARGAVALRWALSERTALRLHADGGVGREVAIGFGPDQGTSPVPLPGAGSFNRDYNPWRAGLELTSALTDSSSITVSYEHFVTAFYTSDEAAIRFSKRF